MSLIENSPVSRRVYSLPEFTNKRLEQKRQAQQATNRILTQIFNQVH